MKPSLSRNLLDIRNQLCYSNLYEYEIGLERKQGTHGFKTKITERTFKI